MLACTLKPLEEVRLSLEEENKEDFSSEAGTTRAVIKVSWRVGTEALWFEEALLVLGASLASLRAELTEPLRPAEAPGVVFNTSLTLWLLMKVASRGRARPLRPLRAEWAGAE